MSWERIEQELKLLREGGQLADLFTEGRAVVVYRQVPTGGPVIGLPPTEDVVVPVPPGYPANMIDLAGLPIGSPFLGRARGSQNNQGAILVAGRQWQLASYHPHNGGGGPPWDQMRHGFHTYLDQLIAWLDKLT
jgi:hypothetical protein